MKQSPEPMTTAPEPSIRLPFLAGFMGGFVSALLLVAVFAVAVFFR